MDFATNNAMYFSPYDTAEKTPIQRFECWVERTYQSAKLSGRNTTRVSILNQRVAREIAAQYGISDKLEMIRTMEKEKDKAERR